MTALIQYERALAALAQCQRAADVIAFSAEMEHVKLYGKQVKDKTLVADATEMQTRAERRLGELIAEAKEKGWIKNGRPKNVPSSEQFSLEEAGIDRKLSSRAQQLANLPKDEFERSLGGVRERVMGGSQPINGARAVMGSRVEAEGSLDFSPTPPWGTRVLIERVLPALGIRRGDLQASSVWEPACGEGHMAEVLDEYFGRVEATDIKGYGYGNGGGIDFLKYVPHIKPTEWIITNPPFGDKAEQFALKALELGTTGVAIFVQLRWLETVGRYERLFRDNPPTLIAFFAERINLCMGRWEPDGTTATAYIWVVWMKGRAPRAPIWIPPGQREALTKPDDVERFTTHPVTHKPKLPPHDPDTGEIVEASDDLSIPECLRRVS